MTFQSRQRIARNGVANRLVWNRLEKRDFPLVGYRRYVLRQGSRGAAVVVLQRALKVPADGVFGPRTKSVVKYVQARARLKSTGVVNGWTWVVIENRMLRR